MTNIYIGYDPREWEAALVCEHSIRAHTQLPVNIFMLDLTDLRMRGIYDRPYMVDGNGQMHDMRDERPFSVAFSFSRFLVPLMAPKGAALFVDCDFVFLRDVKELFNEFNPDYAVQVVKHNHKPIGPIKMDGISQQAYPRKNWSSCMLFNVGHPAHQQLTVHDVNHWPGRDLHAFKWLPDELIGSLPERWNWLADASPTCGGTEDDLGAIHYTSGGPWFQHMRGCKFHEFYDEAAAAMWRSKSDQQGRFF